MYSDVIHLEAVVLFYLQIEYLGLLDRVGVLANGGQQPLSLELPRVLGQQYRLVPRLRADPQEWEDELFSDVDDPLLGSGTAKAFPRLMCKPLHGACYTKPRQHRLYLER